ncbi:MAG: carboxy terminal-processing peptidase [Colwellia sp.]
MQKSCQIALTIFLSMALSFSSNASEQQDSKSDELTLPVLQPETQHEASTKRITARFMRSHYKKIQLNDALSKEIYAKFIKQLDYSRNVFLVEDIKAFDEYSLEFDTVIARGQLEIPYQIFNLNLQRRLERYEYALSLLEAAPHQTALEKDDEKSNSPFDFNTEQTYSYDREDAPWAVNKSELDALWYLKVKSDALNLTLTGKSWEKTKKILNKRYKYAIKRLKQSESEDVFQLVMNSFARVVEPHTSYLSPRNAERFQMDMNLSLEGIGAVLSAEEDYTVIQSVVTGGPADKSKQLKAKDRIVGVAQSEKEFEDVIGWRLDDVVEKIKGPKGTTVRLQVLSGESDDEANIKIVTIVRDTIKLEDRAAKSEVYFKENDQGANEKLGIITIPSFYNNLSKDVNKEITSLKKEGVEGIIVDLRGNGGGSLTEATLLTGLFIDKGPVVQIRDGANRVDVNQDRDGITYYSGPLTVMVDRYSASASEIFAAAIQDYGRGVIIGEHTFGKGTVQQHRGLGRIYDLYEKPLGSIQYTIAKFYRINGGSTQHRGVLPDIEFPTAINPEDWGESKEENALPWDQIPEAYYAPLKNLSADIKTLSSNYEKRITGNPEFNYLLADIVEYRAEKDDKTISLNLKERKAKREANKEKQLARANERLVVMGKEEVDSLDDLPDELDDLDPFLDEAARITFDFVAMNKVVK